MNEFELIARYFTRPSRERQGVGDDCALIDVGDRSLAITCDMLIERRHFFSDADPMSLGHKALAVNLSDLAAAGATPRCFLLALALPRADEAWLQAFSAGMLRLADEFACELIGGDTTRAPAWEASAGPLTICITALGEVAAGAALSRAGARPGDDIWVSGTLGDAALALALADGAAHADAADRQACAARLERPTPRVRLGEALRGRASAAIDVSDGLLGDLGHIAERSRVGARLRWPELPLSAALLRQPAALQQRCALAGGDDYELLFCAPLSKRREIEAAGRAAGVPVTRIGEVLAGSGIVVLDAEGSNMETPFSGFDHFGA
ncbi:MAG: thiamine-phosphate kinase [Gemmatimonadota bacterium]